MTQAKAKRLHYPPAPTAERVDDYHGTLVADPYRPLEDPAAPHTRSWLEAQNRLTEEVLGGVAERDALRARLSELWDYPKALAPFKKGGRWFGFRNSGLQNQDVLYALDGPDDPGRVLIDPNALSADGTVALNPWALAPSRDGSHLAYALSESGSDWQTWGVLEVSSGQRLGDTLFWSKFSGAAWLPDGSGFFYARYDAPKADQAYTGANYYQKLFCHRLETAQEEDELVYERPDEKEWGFEPTVSHDGRYLVLSVWRGTDTRNLLFYRDLREGDSGADGFSELVSDFEASYSFAGNVGGTFYLRTDLGAPKGRLVAVDLARPDKEGWRTVVPEGEDVLQGAMIVGGELIALYLHHTSHRLRRFSLEGEPKGEVALPALGSVTSLHGEPDEEEATFDFTSFLQPTTPYLFNVRTGETRTLAEPALAFDPSPYTTRQVFATSKDGTRVPMFLVHRKDLPDGRNPTLLPTQLYGYGGFNISLTPSFAVSRLVWLERGGVLAVANLRGGGEYGESWHQAGMLEKKQNVFDDFIACAQWLMDEGLTAPEKLAVQGGSNGGLLVGACMTQRPELFGAALPAVGVMDMLRFHQFTIGWAWVPEYGSADDPAGFRVLRAYSPLHNLKPGTRYPATFITTADFDDRVVPAHSYKFAAALQAAQAGDAPVLIRVQTKAGHGLGKPTRLIIEEQADILAFLLLALGETGS
jgi:prolyl oligopeptidase